MEFIVVYCFLFIVLALSVYFDSTQRKIPNKITIPAILIGVIWSTVSSGLDGFLFSVWGFLLGFAVFLVPYILGGIGAGDVKLMAAIGALMGWEFTLASGLATAIAGGVIAVFYMLIKGGLKQTIVDMFGLIVKPIFKFLYLVSGNGWFLKSQKYFVNHKAKRENEYIPYAIAIALGVLIVFLFRFDSLIQF